MRILYDAKSVRTPAGVYVFRGLAAAWADDSRIERVTAVVRADFDRTLVPPSVECIVAESSSWLLHVGLRIPRVADRCRADVIFAPNGLAPRDRRSVAYFQDLSHFRTTARQYRGYRARVGRQGRGIWRSVAAKAWMLAVPISEVIAAEVRKAIPSRSVVIPNGVDVAPFRWTGTDDYIFVMGGAGARKNEDTAVEAWAAIPKTLRRRMRLVVGGVAPAQRRLALEELASSLGLAQEVSIVGGMPREVYLEHISRSRAAISCSTFEAFGLPVAEALAVGAPVLCSAIPSHLEILARSAAGRSFDPTSVGDLTRHLVGVLQGDLPPRLPHPPHDWSWRARAREHVDAYLAAIAFSSGCVDAQSQERLSLRTPTV